MIEWVWRRSAKALGRAVVATDDNRIATAVENFGGEVVLTRDAHTSGTSRCTEALEKIELQTGEKFEVVVNVQGDSL